MNYGKQIVFISFFLISFLAKAQRPVAKIVFNGGSVVPAGSTIQLDGSASTGTLYSWKLIEAPEGVRAELSTPAPAMPSLILDREGLYVVELVTSDGERFSVPEYIAVTAVAPAGAKVLASQQYSPSSLCSFSGEFLECTQTQETFSANPGNYTLNIRANSLTDLTLTLNGEKLRVPIVEGEVGYFSTSVMLKRENRLEVLPEGNASSFVTIEIVGNELPSGMNNPPTVGDISLSINNRARLGSGTLAVFDIDKDQNHTSEILGNALNGRAYLNGSVFGYEGEAGFKGQEIISILTYDSGTPVMGTISKVTVDVSYNTGPVLTQAFNQRIPVGDEAYSFGLPLATDLEGDDLTYTLNGQPSQGTVNCEKRKQIFHCVFTSSTKF